MARVNAIDKRSCSADSTAVATMTSQRAPSAHLSPVTVLSGSASSTNSTDHGYTRLTSLQALKKGDNNRCKKLTTADAERCPNGFSM
jgi:hypothetical protein